VDNAAHAARAPYRRLQVHSQALAYAANTKAE
jgi:hypothetical protein